MGVNAAVSPPSVWAGWFKDRFNRLLQQKRDKNRLFVEEKSWIRADLFRESFELTDIHCVAGFVFLFVKMVRG